MTPITIDADAYRSIWLHMKEVPFTQQFIEVLGYRTRVVTAGDPSAPAVLLLHGTGGHWETFSALIPELYRERFVIAIDMVGNGFSDKPDIPWTTFLYAEHALAVLDHFGVERADLIGSSLGAWVVARIAFASPERTNRVILMSPAGLTASASNMARIKRQRTAAVENPEWTTIKAMFDHLIAEEKDKIPDIIALRQAIYRKPETLATVDRMLTLQEAGIREENLLSEDDWHAITAQVLVIVAGKDVGEYTSTARQILELMPNSVGFEMPHVAHWPAFEDPATFNPVALRFLASGEVR